MSAILEIKDLCGGYEEGANVLHGINLSVEANEAVGILGLNGSGKSTLGRAIMNLLPHRSGEIWFKGQNVTSLDTSRLAQMGIAFMQQGGTVFQNLSEWENLQLAFGSHPDKTYMAQLAEIVPLLAEPKQKLARTMADRLSGGERHKLALAMALANRPQLLILDEPSAGLSPIAVEEMYDMLKKIKQALNITLVIIEQNIYWAVSFCERCEMIVSGRNQYVFADKENSIESINNLLFYNKV